MKEVYPIIISEEKGGYYVSIPDFDIATQGSSIAESIAMARDAIGIMGIDMEDEGKLLPKPYSVKKDTAENEIITLVDVDFNQVGKDISWGFQVDSLEEMIQKVKVKGIPVESGPFQPNPYTKFFYVLDPNGLKIQFVESK